MSKRNFKEYTILDGVTPKTITSSTDATPIVITKTSHGLSTGDQVLIFGHTTNVAANGIYKVTVLSSSTFSLQNIDTGANIAGSGAGAGGATGFFLTAPKVALVEDYNHAVFSVDTSGTATLTLSVAGSIGKLRTNTTEKDTDRPNFGATQSASNPWSYLGVYNLDSAAGIAGSTGIGTTAADIHNTYQTNIDGLKYLTVFPSAWTAGAITIKLQLFTNQ